MPGGSTRSDYITGVGVGHVGSFGTLQSPGGNGAILLTFNNSSTALSIAPSLGPTSAAPSLAPMAATSSAPLAAPSSAPSFQKRNKSSQIQN